MQDKIIKPEWIPAAYLESAVTPAAKAGSTTKGKPLLYTPRKKAAKTSAARAGRLIK